MDQLRFKRETSSHGVASTATDYTSSQYWVIGGWNPGETNTGNPGAAASFSPRAALPFGPKIFHGYTVARLVTEANK